MRNKSVVIFRTWCDFVLFPLDPNRVKSAEQWLDVRFAALLGEVTPLEATEGYRIGMEHVCAFGDTFEAMQVGEFGDVTIWTRKNVWCIRRECGQIEKLLFLPRFPTESAGFTHAIPADSLTSANEQPGN